MNYPTWDVPLIGSVWVVGAIAIFHVMISHFAVGGGLYLALAERKAVREQRTDWLEVIRKHSKFFLILTGVFGAVSGVGIWFSIGLASPESTSALIHNFVFGWAMEWCFFLVEIATAGVYYYTWHRVDARTHQRLGWIYAISSYGTLVLINGILSFMLTPGDRWLAAAGTGTEPAYFWSAFFNPTFWPSLALRTLVCCSLAGVWALVTASRLEEHLGELKAEVIRWSVRWLIPSFFLMPLAVLWYWSEVPENSRHLIQAGVSTIGSGLFTQVTRATLVTAMTSATILAIAYFLAWRNPRDFHLGHAVAVVFLALAATGSTEHAREMIRKPFTIGQYMYSDGVRRLQVAELNRVGYTTASPWNHSLDVGQLMFRGQCLNCHTLDGYRSIRRLLNGRDRKGIANMLAILHDQPKTSPYKNFMPPLAGTPAEMDALANYLNHLANEQQAVAGVSRGATHP
ncbi:MAG: cytochrome ubiquinol oxidase subunit I [Acidobacteria bacterium]|nr:cytochrome ubiquinol oxidase subunit I [Acidobacteriota bacterium]